MCNANVILNLPSVNEISAPAAMVEDDWLGPWINFYKSSYIGLWVETGQ